MQYCLKALLLVLALAASAAAGNFRVFVDTSLLSAGTSGYLDLQFNGAGNPTPSGTAIVSRFSGSGFSVDDSLALSFGAVAGALVPGPLSMSNTDVFNDYFVPFTGGGPASAFSLVVTLSGDILAPDPGNLNGTDFALLMFADDGFTPLLTIDGQLARIAVTDAGAIVPEAYGPADISAIPEPSTILLAGGGLLIVALRAQRKRRC